MTPGLQLYTSNRLECLAEQLAIATARPLASPLTPEIIVVQSRGMARWASMQIARLTGICMNCDFPFPKSFVEATLRQFFPDMAPESGYSVGVMAWKIFGLLPSMAQHAEFAQVANYLGQDDGLKRFQLAERLADLFDQYLVYRPDMLMRWQRDRTEMDWQAILWRGIVAQSAPLHLAAIAEALRPRMEKRPPGAALPERISLFGLSSIPPFYLRVFFELARHCEVHVFALEPSQEYFGHDLSAKAHARLNQDQPATEDLGNPLLTSLGKLNRDLTELRIELNEQAGFVIRDETTQFFDPIPDHMLGMIQHDILHAQQRGSADLPALEVSATDDSVQLHACHSPMREVEVLFDNLLGMFAADPTLRPRDILIMTPDIDRYSPLIQAVFGFPESAKLSIPFSIADRRASSGNSAVETLLALLDLPGSRVTASEIFALLERGPIRRCFEFTDDDLVTIRSWIAETGIRWGIDGKHRATFDLPDLEGHTWRAGLRRLLLGYAMNGGNRITFEGILPYDEVEGTKAEVLGRFLAATDALFETAKTLPIPRTLREWPEELAAIVQRFIPGKTAEELADLEPIWTAVQQLRRSSADVETEEAIDFRVIRHQLRRLLDQGESRGGFLNGGVTFCALQPMRTVPAKVIALLGMGDQAFPRNPSTPGFDWIAREQRLGDRSVRNDDRYLFLESLVSARDRLYLSYVGRSVIDNELIPPSVLVSELFDYLGRACRFPNGDEPSTSLTREHRLHAFSEHYFSGGDPSLFSYSEANAAAARSIHEAPREAASSFFKDSLSEPQDEFRSVDLRKLVQFYAAPATYFVRQRLGVSLDERDDSLSDNEPFALDGLQSYQFREELLQRAADGIALGSLDPAVQTALPLREIGASYFHALRKETERFWKSVEPEVLGQPIAEPWLAELNLGSFSLTGKIQPIYGQRLVHFRSSSLKPKDWLGAWIFHLAKCAVRPTAVTETVLIGTDTKAIMGPVADANAELSRLLDVYWQGLTRPIPFFPIAGLAYAKALICPSEKSKTTPLQRAGSAWHGSSFTGSGEKKDVYLEFCFGDAEPLDQEFTSLSLAVFGPMLKSLVASP